MGISQLGDWLYYVSFMVFLYERTGALAAIGVWMVVRQVAYVAVGPPAAAWAERFDRRQWLVGVNLAKLAVMAALTLVVATNGPVSVGIALAFLSSALTAGYTPILFAAVPDAVEETRLARSYAMLASVEKAAMIGGPLVGGLVLALFGEPAVAVALNAASFIASAAVVNGVGRHHRATSASSRARRGLDFAAGFRALGGSSDAWVVAVMSAAAMFAFGCGQVVYVAVSEQRLGTGTAGVTALLAAFGLGGAVGALVTGSRAARIRTVPALALSFLASALPLAVLTQVNSPLMAYVVLAVGGAAFGTFQVLAATVLQRAVTPRLLARVWAIVLSIGYAGTLLGSAAASMLADRVSLVAALVAPAVVAAVALLIVALPLRQLDARTEVELRAFGAIAESLGRLPLFDSASRATLEQLARAAIEETVEPGTVVIRDGDEADDFFVILTGEFEVSVGDEATRRVINTMGPLDWFGEIGLIQRRPRTATVTATTASTVWRIPGTHFLDAFDLGSTLPGPLDAGMNLRLARTHPDEVMGTR